MRFLPVALTGVLLALCFAALAARGPVCDRKHHHPRAIYNADHCAHSLHAPKVALLFLTRGPLPFESVWRRWFHEVAGLAYTGCADGDHDHVQLCGRDREADPIAQQHMYTVYVHTPPDFPGYPKEHLFHGYELANRAEAHWNDLTLAMYMLVHAAVHNPVNAFFVLLSEACVPLYPAAAVYLEVIHEPRSRLAAGCEGVPDFGVYEAPRRRLGQEEYDLKEEEEYPPYVWVKTSQWFLINRKHAELTNKHMDDRLLSWADEWYIGSLLKTYNLSHETNCDWQGPTYTNWSLGGDHPATYHSFDSDLLHRMRLSSVFADVKCEWQSALDQAVDPAHYLSLETWEHQGDVPGYQPMNSTCPLFARKLAPEVLDSFMMALWPAQLRR